MNINQKLPDLCLIKILSQLTIRELFKAKLVCHRWYHLIPVVFKQKQCLRIFGCNNLDYYSNVHYLRCDRLDFFGVQNQFDFVLNFCVANFEESDQLLAEEFSNVRELTLVHYKVCCLWKVLQHFSKITES